MDVAVRLYTVLCLVLGKWMKPCVWPTETVYKIAVTAPNGEEKALEVE